LRCLGQAFEQNEQLRAKSVAARGGKSMQLEKRKYNAFNSFSRVTAVGIKNRRSTPVVN
jgi:hypothetical protein